MARFRAGLTALALALASAGSLAPFAAAVDPGGNCNDAPCYTLTVVAGDSTGSGSWQTTNSSQVPNGIINCQLVNGAITQGSTCSHEYGGIPRVTPITIYYLVTPATGSKQCSSPPCSTGAVALSLILSANSTVNAGFVLQSFAVTVSKTGAGSGTVTSAPAGIACGATCSKTFLYGTDIMLYAGPDAGAYFAGWTGACFGQGPGCSLTIPASSTSTNAVFGFGTPPPSASPPGATPRATVKPPGTPRPSATAGSAPTVPPPSGQAESTPVVSGEPATSDPGVSSGPSLPSSTDPPAAPASSSGSDFTPIVLAILGAGLLIALGIGFAALALRRRGVPPAG